MHKAGKEKGNLQIRDVYKISKDSEIILQEKYGVWTPFKGMKIFEPDILKRRSNFHGHQLK